MREFIMKDDAKKALRPRFTAKEGFLAYPLACSLTFDDLQLAVGEHGERAMEVAIKFQ